MNWYTKNGSIELYGGMVIVLMDVYLTILYSKWLDSTKDENFIYYIPKTITTTDCP